MLVFSYQSPSVVYSVIYEINYTKLNTFIFLKEDDLCYVLNGSFWWQGLRHGIFSANLDVVFILSLVWCHFCIYCTMIMDNWHVTEIPQKQNSQEKILRWGHYIPKDTVTGKLLFIGHECKYPWTCAIHEDRHPLLKSSQLKSGK